METKENQILKKIQSTFILYSNGADNIRKRDAFKLFFEMKIIDVNEFNIFLLNYHLAKSSNQRKCSFEYFLKLILFIYSIQKNKDIEFQYDFNLPTLPEKDEITKSNNIINVLVNLNDYIEVCFPNFDEKLIKRALNSEIFEYLNDFSENLYKIFNENANKSNNYLHYININKLIPLFFELPIYSNINSKDIAQIVSNFICPWKVKVDTSFIKIFDELLSKNNPNFIENEFSLLGIDSNNLNFTFSSFVLLLICFGLHYNKNEATSDLNATEYFIESILELKKNTTEVKFETIDKTESIIEEEETFPESANIKEAFRMIDNPNKDDFSFLQETLYVLDRELLVLEDENENIVYPLEKLSIEVEEEEKRKTDEKEAKIIKLARKPPKRPNDRNAKPPRPHYFEDKPDPDKTNLKYFGYKTIENFTNRLMKQSINDILPNSKVYPSLLKDVLLIPKSIPAEVIKQLIRLNRH